VKAAILTVFPDLVRPFFTHAMVRIACERGAIEPIVIDIREFATDRYRSVDDYPYGGGPGMVMTPGPLSGAIQHALAVLGGPAPVVLMSPQGECLEQRHVLALAAEPRLVLVCGRYKGVDERIIERYVSEELSLGDYVLSGGELAALVVLECVTRHLEGVLGDPESAASDSFATGLLEGPLYTRPEEFEGMRVPEVLLSGNHARIAEWRQAESLRRTRERRPDLLAKQVGEGGQEARRVRTRSKEEA
jgi:tRNA (guanine37-N1)-methyltransferase